MGDLLKMVDPSGYSIMVRQLEKDGNYRPVLRDIQKSKCNNVILDCSLDILPEVLIQAQQVGIMIAEYNFIITNLVWSSEEKKMALWRGETGMKTRIVGKKKTFLIKRIQAKACGEGNIGNSGLFCTYLTSPSGH